MHKTYLNEEEVQLIKGADKIVKKIGGFPSMENGRLCSFLVKESEKEFCNDIELIFDIAGWLHTLDFYLTGCKDINDKIWDPYRHKDFRERHVKMLFHNCKRFNLQGLPLLHNGEIKFGGVKQNEEKNRYQDRLPGHDIIIDRPYTCFYICVGDELIIYFDESECEISAELIE